jgi:YkoY family integral membrane protein
MDSSLILEYGWVLLVLIFLEGILAADNALVLAIMVKHLPEQDRRKALFYGLAGAFIFRLGSLFLISFLVYVWQVQAIGAAYLLFIALNHLFRKFVIKRDRENPESTEEKRPTKHGFWLTVLKVELADIAFAVDSILAAIAIALTLTPTGLFTIGGLDGGQFMVILAGGLTGVVIMRYAATFFVRFLHRRPGLETAAFLIVGWVGVKLLIYTFAHTDVAILPHHFPEAGAWKTVFWSVLILIGAAGWFLSKPKPGGSNEEDFAAERSLNSEDQILNEDPQRT